MTAQKPQGQAKAAHGSGSVAHEIIGEFITDLRKKDGFAEIAAALEKVVYDASSEANLRAAIFGDESI